MTDSKKPWCYNREFSTDACMFAYNHRVQWKTKWEPGCPYWKAGADPKNAGDALSGRTDHFIDRGGVKFPWAVCEGCARKNAV